VDAILSNEAAKKRWAAIIPVARGLALFLGGFSLLNLLGEMRCAGFSANSWWIDLRPLGGCFSGAVLAAASLLLVAFGIRVPCTPWRRMTTGVAVLFLAGAAAVNAFNFHLLTARQSLETGCPVAFSFLVLCGLAVILAGISAHATPDRAGTRMEIPIMCLTIAACTIALPLGQMVCFGMTDYRRPADVVIVFGARVYADGRTSQAAGDRVRTACSLYHDGWTHKVILSGGPGDGDIHETEGMRRMAVQLGVPEGDILLDEQGLNTEATVQNTCRIIAESGLSRVLVVSHFYHLPRIKLAYQRHGQLVCTVPAKQTRVLSALPIYMSREVAALWLYYMRPLLP
jgi:vancomycin permeability regulator SanA